MGKLKFAEKALGIAKKRMSHPMIRNAKEAASKFVYGSTIANIKGEISRMNKLPNLMSQEKTYLKALKNAVGGLLNR